ncbi:hypothetical protein [Paludibacterium paludis]|uniref:Uncharacterized protein n=1 Tax=Paludibacterium paludis TaxID=1225769 RepID=A0A918U969_9NEIS|nr:hypothetical protein [Paludibacterium paludis]GGY11957.1 hypothetical protein GCM10011289_13660 [Paludibacterium paludis]
MKSDRPFPLNWLGHLARLWWRGMTIHTNRTLRAETEALERYRDMARNGLPPLSGRKDGDWR